MKHGTIVIAGAIGQFEFGGRQINGVRLIDVVSSVMNLGDIDTLTIQIESMGGRKDVGDQIYNYLNSLKPKIHIITEQIGDIASIATKLFAVGDRRIATRGFEFLIHNVWTTATGDANTMSAIAEELRVEENELRSFYQSLTGISEEGLKPLMDDETKFDADTALKINFATEIKEPLKLVAMMKNETKQKLVDLFSRFLNMTNGNESFNMVVELDGGQKLFIQSESADNLIDAPVFQVDEQGNQSQESPADGEYKLMDGRTIVVTGGKITEVKPAEQQPDPNEIEIALNAKLDQLIEKMSNTEPVEQKLMKVIDEKFSELRASIKTKHVPTAYKPESHNDLVAEWERSFRAGEHKAMRKENPEKYRALYYAKFGKEPANV